MLLESLEEAGKSPIVRRYRISAYMRLNGKPPRIRDFLSNADDVNDLAAVFVLVRTEPMCRRTRRAR